MTEIAALGLRVDGVQNVDKASASLDKLSTSSDKAQKSTDGLAGASKKTSKGVDDLSRSSRSASSSIGSIAASAARAAAALGLFVSVGAAIRGGIRTINEFEQGMARVRAITRATDSEMVELTKTARYLGSVTEFTAAQAADGLKFLGMAGFTARESMAAIPDVLNLAISAALDLGTAADIASNVMSGFGIAATDASRAVDVLAAASSRSNTDINQLGDAIAYVGPVASAMGIDIGDATAAIGVLSDAGIQGSSAGTGLRRVLSSLANPTKQAAEVLSGLGVSIESVNPATNDLSDIINTLSKTSMSAADALTIFGDRGGPAILALVANNSRVGELSEILSDVEGEAARMAATMSDTLIGDTKSLASAMEELALSLGDATGITSGLRSAVQWMTQLVRSISSASSVASAMVAPIKTLGSVIAEIYRTSRDAAGQITAVVNSLVGLSMRLPSASSLIKRFSEEMQDAAQWAIFLSKAGINAITGNAKGAMRAWGDLQKTLKDREGERQGRRIDALLVDVTKRTENLSYAAVDLSESTSIVSSEAEELEKKLQSLIDKYDNLGAKQRTATAELAGLQKAASLGLPGAEEAIDGFYESLMVADDALQRKTKSVKENAAEADPFAQSWQAALERIDNAFVDLWKSAFNGFKDFADSLKNAFIQLLAELAHRATTQKILVSLGFTAGSGGAMAGGVGGAGGGLMSNIFSAGSWISAGKTLWQGFSGLATGQGLSGFSGLFGGHAANSALIPQHMLTRAASQQAAAMTNFTNTVGPILAGIGGAIQGWQTGSKANAVTGAVGGWGGAKLGASYGSTFGPIGTAVGAVIGGILGSALGSSVFGSGWQDRRQGIQLGFGEEGLMLEEWTRQTKKGGWFGSTKRRYRYSEMEEAMADEFRTGYDAMIDVLGNQFLAIGADLDRAVFEAVKIGSASINTSDQTEEEVQAQIEKWFSDLQQAMVRGALSAAGDPSAAVRLLRATGGDAAMLEALGGLMGVAGSNAVQQARDAQTQLSMVESYRAVTDATRTLIGEYDGSLEATLGLTEAMGIQQEMAFSLATAYLQASDAVGALFGNLRESIRTSLMGAEELYEYQRGQVHNLTDLLGTLTDPEAIYRASQEIERLVSGMWGRLDETQRVSLGDEFLDYLDRTEALAQERLAKGLAELESTQADIYSALTTQMNDVADRMIETAAAMQEAANLQWQSALQFGAYVSQLGGIMSNIGQGQEQNA